jgi:hypothetical protein
MQAREGPKQIPLVVVDQHDSGIDVKASDKQDVKQPSSQMMKDAEDYNNDTGVHSGKLASMVRQSCLCTELNTEP